MSWIYLSILVALYLFYYFFIKNYKKEMDVQIKNNKDVFLNEVRTNWKELRVKSEDCSFINYSTKIDTNSAEYLSTTEIVDENFYEWITGDVQKDDVVDLPRTKIWCPYKFSDTLTKDFSIIVNMDITIVEFKTKLQDYVSIYIPNDTDIDNYFIDLEFLNKEIDFTKFNK